MRLPLTEPAPVPFVTRLASFGDRAALVTGTGTVSYTELADRVADFAAALGPEPRLMVVAGANEVEPIVAYLGALTAGHPVILTPGDSPGNLASLVAAYDPDVVYAPTADGSTYSLVEHRTTSAHDLHPDLALLMSTSGSTGSPKLVRLSHTNLQANAAAIAEYLQIRGSDVAATTLPMHYCYGLSVINSHLHAGAALMLTSLSVVDPCFWESFGRHGATTFAGVPYTFELLDRVGFESMDLPSLRYVTQAGGRLAPETVRRFAALGQRRGWDLFVMYGQTEATARMAYLPPDLALTEPTSIGLPIPGGSFALEPLPERPLDVAGTAPEVGELVYTGDNVMLGYATTPADLSLGRTAPTSLRTGDVARRTDSGLYEIVGRRNRFVKVFGLRIDLDQVERVFAERGVIAACADGGERLVVAVASAAAPVDPEAVRALAREHLGLPRGAVTVLALPEVPRLPTGKPDYRAIATLAEPAEDSRRAGRKFAPSRRSVDAEPAISSPLGVAGLVDLYAELLGRPEASAKDTFVSLGGDSLSYVEMSIRLEQAMGHLPPQWHLTPIAALARATELRSTGHGAGRAERRRGGSVVGGRLGLRSVETNVVLRALAIVCIVASHSNVFQVMGGAHLLLGLAGFNFARFQLSAAPRTERVRRMAISIGRIVVPSVLWIGAVTALLPGYGWPNVLLLNGVFGPSGWAEPQWQYWFIEALVYTLVGLTALLAIPWLDRLERRWSFWLPVGLAVAGLLTRYEVVTVMPGDVIHRANVVFWLFALGWATAKATSHRHRVVVTLLVVATVPGFFEEFWRGVVVIAGMVLLVWVTQVRVPALLTRMIGVLAGASLYIYLAHWQIYPHLEMSYPLLATTLSLAGGVVFWKLAQAVAQTAGRWSAGRRPVGAVHPTRP